MGERIGNRGTRSNGGGHVRPVDLPDKRFELGDQGIELGHELDRIFWRLFSLLNDAAQRQAFTQTLDALLNVSSQHESFTYPHLADSLTKNDPMSTRQSTVSSTWDASSSAILPGGHYSAYRLNLTCRGAAFSYARCRRNAAQHERDEKKVWDSQARPCLD